MVRPEREFGVFVLFVALREKAVGLEVLRTLLEKELQRLYRVIRFPDVAEGALTKNRLGDEAMIEIGNGQQR